MDNSIRDQVEEGHTGTVLSQNLDEDGRPKRHGTMWTASAHIITAVIGSGVLSLAWSMAQLGWIAGPAALIIFSGVTLYTSTLLADCYRSPDPVYGKRNYTYMDAVRANLGRVQIWMCALTQYANLYGTAIGYTITASSSMAAINRSDCFHSHGRHYPCKPSNNPFMIGFGVVQIILSQIPNFHGIWWLSIVAALMSFGYSTIGVGLAVSKVAEGNFHGTVGGTPIGEGMSSAEKVWKTFQALGDIAFAYSYSMVLFEIQDTIGSPPPENKTMKKATLLGVAVTTLYYTLCGCFGYLAFGNGAPGNLLTGFGFYNPFWLVDIANIFIVVHLVGAYQVFAQPVFAFVEGWSSRRWGKQQVLQTKTRAVIAKAVWRSGFVVSTTVIAMALPFFNDVMGLLGAIAFWPLTVYFPVEIYMSQNKIRAYSSRWIALEMLSMGCLIVSLAAACGSVEGIVDSVKNYKPFHTVY